MKTELVTTLKRKATEMISQLQADKKPVLITQHGKPAAVLLDVEAYVELRRRIQILEGIALGEEAYRKGEVLTHEEVRKKMAKWLK